MACRVVASALAGIGPAAPLAYALSAVWLCCDRAAVLIPEG